MGRSRVLQASWYDYPQYYDIASQAYTLWEANFVVAACRKYCAFGARKLLEPACGTGRLVTVFAAQGYQVTGFDLSRPALSYLRRQLTRRRLNAETFEGDMSDFRVHRPVDAAYCTVSTFRHLLTEQAARCHLQCIVRSLRRGGIYVLGLRLLPLDVDISHPERWTQRRGKTKVTVTQRVLSIDRRRRLENVQVCLMARCGSNELRLQHAFQLRTYTARQFRRLLDSVPSLELCGAYDSRYDIEQPLGLNDKAVYTLFVLKRGLLS
jgi:SAM-dependent methyltransferase